MAIQLDDLVARLRLDTSGVSSGLSGLNGSLSSVGDKATAAGRKLTLGVSTPLVGIGIASTKLAATFDKTMRQVSIATGGPADALSDLAKQMGAETAFSANEAADAMLELAKGGMSAVQIEGGALAATMKLASAGGIGLAEASTYVSNSMAGFGLAAKDADDVVVALAGAANASSASVESLGQGLAQGGLAARNAGLSLQETVGVLSLFDAAGLKGSDAGTSLKSALNSLIPTTDKATKSMEQLGLDFVKGNGEFESAANIADQLRKKLGPLSEAQRSVALETIFGSDGMRAATILMNEGREGVVKYTKAAKDQETTTKLANAAMEGTSGAMERAAGSIETAGLALGEVLAPYVERAAKKVEELANAFTELSPETQEMIVKGAALAAVVGPLTIGVGVLASSLSKIVGVAGSVRVALAGVDASAGGTTTRTNALAGSLKKAAGVGGLLALSSGLATAAQEGNSFSSVMQGAAGGAGIGAMFGPIGALVGAGVGGGLTALVGSFKDTAEEAEAARVQLMKTEGFANAKADADTLRESLIGVVSAYGKIPRAAVAASFTGEDGKLDADVAKLRELGVSMDTIVSATLGRADAQKVVDKALAGAIEREQAAAAAATAAYEDVADGQRDVVTQSGQILKNAESLTGDEVDVYRDAMNAAKKPLNDLTTLQETFGERVRRNTGEIEAHAKRVRELAGDLGITVKQYRDFPKNVRTKLEADGLPQTMRDSLRLIGQYDALQNFRSIRAVIEANGAKLTIGQIETLTKRYNLTPKQVKTLVQAVGVENEAGKVRRYKGDLDKIPPNVTTTVTTQYVSRGKREQVERLGTSGRQAADPDKGRDVGYDYADSLVTGLTFGLSERGAASKDKATKAVEKTVSPNMKKLGELLSTSLADSIVGSREHVHNAMKSIMERLIKTGNDAALKIANSSTRALKKLGDQYAQTGRDLKAAEIALTSFEKAREAVEQRQAALAYGGGNIAELTLPEGTELNADAIIDRLENAAFATTQFQSMIDQLRVAGLSQDGIDQLIAKGPEAAYATAQAILAGGPEAIAKINALQQQIAASGLAIQSKSSQTMYDVGVAAQQGLIAGLESQMGVLEDKMTGIAKAMVRAIRKALKIKSPSRVMEGLGRFTGVGFADGLDATAGAVAAASSRLSDAALVTPNIAGAAAMSSSVRRAVGSSTPTTQVRVFIGETELTDIVRVQIGDTFAAGRTQIRQGVL